jgi:SecD/SecF fusion protein
VAVIRERIDPNGTSDVLVTQSGDASLLIELPSMSEQDLELHESRIANLGKLEMRIVADDDYAAAAVGDRPEVRFRLDQEKKRLETWLEQGDNRKLFEAKVDELPNNIRRFNDDRAAGPIAFGNLAWYVHVIRPTVDKDGGFAWDLPSAEMPTLGTSVVKGFTAAQYFGGRVPEDVLRKPEADRFLVEFVAINMHETYFTGESLDPNGVGPTQDQNGLPAVAYSIGSDRSQEYADWSEKYLQKCSAIILNGYVRSAPVFQSRIPGRGQITGSFTVKEVEELVKVLRTGSLRIEPVQVSKVSIGANLGQQAIDRGVYSLALGTALVFAFTLFYYGRAGLIACITLLLNVTLLWAAMLFMQATVTLPGLGGMVLTIGMAVDANVLINERIREELQKGKDLLRAVRAGFDKAMSAILDSNITTFLVGTVLFNIGVGPVRGFAVTLMAGIVMTVFTQFFVTRVLFHYALEKKLLEGWFPRSLLPKTNIDFVRHIRKCLVASIVVIACGVAFAFTQVPGEVMFGIDFTGGANMQMVLRQPRTADEVRATIRAATEFNEAYPNIAVNTIDPDAEDRANSFNLRIKLRDHQRQAIAEQRTIERRQRKEAMDKGETPPPRYEPPYLTALRTLFAEQIVAEAFSNPRTDPDPRSVLLFAEIALHFQSEVKVADAQRLLEEHKLLEGRAEALPDAAAAAARGLLVSWRVSSDIRDWQLFDIARKALTGLQDAGGREVVLSDPFPLAQEIQGRLVDDLRNAAIGALILSWILMIFYLRVRFHEYRFGLAAVAALVHDVLFAFSVVVAFNYWGIVHAEIGINMIAAFLTIIGYSVNDTIVIFDRIRENVQDNARGGVTEPMRVVINRALNQTLSRTLLTTGLTMLVVIAQFFVNWGSESDLESFAFAMIVGMISGTYSTIYIAAPILLGMRQEDIHIKPRQEEDAAVPAEHPAT